MPAYRRAYLYILRKKSKTILLLILFFVIMLLILLGTAINHSSEQAASRLREEIGGYFKINLDYDKWDGEQLVDRELVNQVSKTEGIKKVNTMSIFYLTTPYLMLQPARYTAEGDSKAQLARVLGNAGSDLHEYFILDILRLKEGRHIDSQDKGTVMISDTLADMNDLKIGDEVHIKISEDVSRKPNAAGKEMVLNIVGVFEETEPKEGDTMTVECDLPGNFLFIDEATSEELAEILQETDDISYDGGAAFFVKDPKDIEKVVSTVREINKIDWSGLELSVNNASYEKSAQPLERLEKLTKTMVGLIAGIGTVLITLMIVMWERERIHEAGALMAYGIKKGSIFFQHFLEVVSVYIAAFLIAVLVALPVSGQLGNQLYSGEESFVTSLSMEVIGIAGCIGIIIVVVSISLGFVTIARRKPKDILALME